MLMNDENPSCSLYKGNPPKIPDRYAVEYGMNHKNRGMALILNHKTFDPETNCDERHGTEVDCAKFRIVLKELGFENPVVHNNLSYKEIMTEVKQAALADHQDNDCIVVCILSHGKLGSIWARDKLYNLSEIICLFAPEVCPTLANKPKLFFVQACQGDKVQDGCTMRAQANTETESLSSMGLKIPLHADFLIAFSTVPGYLSWRNHINGSWFIQSLCDELQLNGKRYDLVTLLTFVCRRVAIDYESSNSVKPKLDQRKQVPWVTTMLTRLVLFRDKPKKNSKLF